MSIVLHIDAIVLDESEGILAGDSLARSIAASLRTGTGDLRGERVAGGRISDASVGKAAGAITAAIGEIRRGGV